MKFESNKQVVIARMNIILSEAGGSMAALDFCAAHVARGWALPDFEPADIGCDPDDTIKLRMH